jgi:hypothetical protein
MARTDKYLDSAQVIRDLAAAERNHHLDLEGVMEKLKEAARHCAQKGDVAQATAAEYQSLADQYALARGAYYAEIRRRQEASGGSLSGWVNQNGGTMGIGISARHAGSLANIADAPDPLKALHASRLAANAYQRGNDEKRAIQRDALKLATKRDPLTPIKHEWRKLSPRQQDEFFRWAKTQLRATGRDPK